MLQNPEWVDALLLLGLLATRSKSTNPNPMEPAYTGMFAVRYKAPAQSSGVRQEQGNLVTRARLQQLPDKQEPTRGKFAGYSFP